MSPIGEPRSRTPRPAAHAALRSTAAQVVAKSCGMVLALASVSVVTRALGPADYGRLSLIGVYVSIVVVFADLGLPFLVTREISKDPGRAKEIVGAAFWGRMRLVPVLYVLGLVLALALYRGENVVIAGVAIALAGLVPGSAASSLSSVYQQQLRLATLAWVELGIRVLNLALQLLVVRLDGGVLALVSIGVLLSLVQCVCTFALLPEARGYVASWDRARFRDLLVVSMPLGIALVLNTLYLRFDAIFLSLLRTDSEVGLYMAAYRCMEMILVFPSVLAAVVLPLLSTAASDRVAVRALIDRVVGLVLLGVLPLGGAVLVLAGPLTAALGGAEFAEAGRSLQLLSLAVLTSSVNIVLGLAIIALDGQRRALWLNVCGLLLNVGLNLALVPSHGGPGAAASTSVSELFVMVGALVILRRELGAWPRPPRLVRLLLSGGLAAVCGYAAREAPLPAALAAVVGSYAVAVATLRILGREELSTVRQAFRGDGSSGEAPRG